MECQILLTSLGWQIPGQMSNTFYILEEKRLAQGQPLDLVVLEPHDVHGVVHVDGHGVACPLGVSLADCLLYTSDAADE